MPGRLSAPITLPFSTSKAWDGGVGGRFAARSLPDLLPGRRALGGQAAEFGDRLGSCAHLRGELVLDPG